MLLIGLVSQVDLFLGRATCLGPKARPKFEKVWEKILGLKMGLGKKLGQFKM